ncbi:type IV toxin-antitoxin system AbiEi family antitoxin domain-containing protein [Kribbella sp. NPDC058245]|uniref:type IV toxin-antitoxin system AbiEi family antitoxin domain-containing protein n=1 Tax=Kribbella sp. NPDC058245 TaxID=3346399 RepID=UPI0036E8195E
MLLVDEILAHLGGWATSAQLRQLVTRTALAEAVSRGGIERVARGVYALPALGPERLTALAYDGVASHLSAAHLWGLPLLRQPDKPHVILPLRRHPRSRRPAVLHWASVTPDERDKRMTSLLRTVVDCSRILPFGEALALADAALRSGELGRHELENAAIAMRGPGRPTARRVADSATALAESFLESILRGLLISAGLTEFEPQVVVRDADGFIGRVDLGHRAARLALEAEGYGYHSSSIAFAADCRRYNNLVAAGWLVLRFTYQQILHDSAWVIDRVRTALALRTPSTTLAPVATLTTVPADWAA